MRLYLDTSVIVPLFVAESRSSDAHAGLIGQNLYVSDLAAAEFSAAISARVRTDEMSAADALSLFTTFDAWAGKAANRAQIEAGDMAVTLALVRRPELALRMPDAANLAIAQRLGAKVFTFDQQMAAAAAALGLSVLT
ncbi:MAG: type II toxin-antitoxin system VapC family toxin [Vitreimonas sp.]